MKRTLISLLMTAALLLSLFALPAQAAGQTELTGEWKDGIFTVTMNIPGVSSATLLAAAYENGRMTQVRTRENVTNGKPVRFEDLDSSYQVRVFAIDPKTSQPLCKQKEVRNPDFLNQDDMVVFHDTVPLEAVDDTVTAALSSALSSYAQVMLALGEVDRYLTETDADGRTRLDSVSSSSGGRLLPGGIGKNLPRRPHLGSVSIPTKAPVISKPVAHPAFDASMDQVNAALDTCGQMFKANAVLAAAAEQETAVLQSEVRAMEAASLQGGVSDEQLAWAKSITEHYDAIESSKKIAQLARDLGCDAKRAYAQLTMAQNILKGQYSKEEGDLNELWEKRMIATKAGCKVGLFVCATIATAGGAAATATAAAPLGYISAGQAAGIAVGAVDATIEVYSAGGKIILGPDSKVVKRFDDMMKPVSDACLVFGLFTGGGDSVGEKLAFLGDLEFRKQELYDNIKLKYNVDLNRVEAEILTLNPMDPADALKLAKELLPEDTDLGLEKEPSDKTVKEVLETFTEDRQSDDETLQKILDEVDPENPIKLKDAVKEFNQEVDEKIEKDYPEDDDHTPTVTEKPPRIWQGFDEDGNLYEERCSDSEGNRLWSKYYDTETHLLTSEVAVSGAKGERIEKWTRYYATPEELIETGGVHRLKDIIYYQEDEYGRFDRPWFGSDHLFYDEKGVLVERKTANRDEQYTGSGQLSLVSVSEGGGVHTTYSYYTYCPSDCSKFDPTGHLQYVETTQPSDSPYAPPHVLYKRVWDIAQKVPIDNGTKLAYGLRMTDWVGAESDFEIYFTEPND